MKNRIADELIKGDFVHKNILSLSQFDRKSLDLLFATTRKIITKCKQNKCPQSLAGKIITLLFFEPSSRTFSSFSSAIKRLGGQTVEYQNPMETSSAVKGESLADTIRVFESYSDLIVIRHQTEGTAQAAAEAARFAPIVNAGDGGHEHPTQALLDLFTLHQKFGRLDNLVGVMSTDPLHSRTIRSLALGLSLYPNNTIYLLSPKHLRMNPEVVKEIKKRGTKVVEIFDTKDIPTQANFWYWNRIQKERFSDTRDYESALGKFSITPQLLKEKGNKDMIIMDPLPRVEEIDPRVDEDPRAYYFHQVRNGLFVRMALLSLILRG